MSSMSFVSSAGYGFLLDRNEISHWRLGSDRPDAWQTEVAAPQIDYVVAPGDGRTAIGALTSFTGRQPVPPRWAVGPAFDRLVKYPSDPPDQYAAEVAKDIEDVEGDVGRVTLPMILDAKGASWIVAAALVIAVGLSPMPVLFGVFNGINETASFAYLAVVALADAIFLYSGAVAVKGKRPSGPIKLGMLFGLAAFLAGSLAV